MVLGQASSEGWSGLDVQGDFVRQVVRSGSSAGAAGRSPYLLLTA